MVDKFPLFLKTINGSNYYWIASAERVTEYQRIGSRWLKQEWTANTLPERWYVNDLIENVHNNVLRITEDDFWSTVPQNE